MEASKINIVNEKDSIRTTIEIDGKKLENVKSFEFKQVAGELPVLKLEMYVSDTAAKGKAVLEKLFIQ